MKEFGSTQSNRIGGRRIGRLVILALHHLPRQIMRSLLVIVCLLSVAPLSSAEQTKAAQRSRSLSADLSFHFECKEGLRSDVEKQIEFFLRGHGFKVLNQAGIQRQHNVYIFDTDMVALDGDQRMVEVTSVPGADRRYSFGLYSQPPTNHSASLEQEILNFVSENLKCETRQTARKENGEEQKEFYESELRRVQSLFEQADRINGGRHI